MVKYQQASNVNSNSVSKQRRKTANDNDNNTKRKSKPQEKQQQQQGMTNPITEMGPSVTMREMKERQKCQETTSFDKNGGFTGATSSVAKIG